MLTCPNDPIKAKACHGLWGDSSDDDEEASKMEAPKPPECKSGSKPARRCADLFDWTKLEPFNVKGK